LFCSTTRSSRVPGQDEPSITRAALFDPINETWQRLPDSEILTTDPWLVDGATLVNPTLGGGDGGLNHNWGRFHYSGGTLDLMKNVWSALPALPTDPMRQRAAGAVDTAGARYTNPTGWVLDTTRQAWIHTDAPSADVETTRNATVVAAGRDLFVSAEPSGRAVNRGRGA
jgi:hypothetical protein